MPVGAGHTPTLTNRTAGPPPLSCEHPATTHVLARSAARRYVSGAKLTFRCPATARTGAPSTAAALRHEASRERNTVAPPGRPGANVTASGAASYTDWGSRIAPDTPTREHTGGLRSGGAGPSRDPDAAPPMQLLTLTLSRARALDGDLDPDTRVALRAGNARRWLRLEGA